jgi:hypothetical protein
MRSRRETLDAPPGERLSGLYNLLARSFTMAAKKKRKKAAKKGAKKATRKRKKAAKKR